MDFIDYDTFQDDGASNGDNITTLPEPAPPLLLPINANIASKFKGLSLLGSRNIEPTSETRASSAGPDDANITTKTAEKYAKLSLRLFESSGTQPNHGLLSDLPVTKGSLNEHFTKSGNSKPDQLLSSKLANVLNNYGMNETNLRDALKILQQKQDLDLEGLIRSDMLGAIMRRRFRSDIEGELLKEHTTVLRGFQPVVQKVEHLGQKIDKLNKLNAELNNSQAIDPAVIEKIQDLSTEKNLITLKKSVLNSFKKNFTLTQYEEHYLSNEDISMEYFQILHKCKTIHTNSSILLTLQNPALGMKIMSKMSKFLDLSYQRISFFLSTQLERATSDGSRYADTPSTNPTDDLRLMKISIFYLSNSLKYFDDITSKLVQSRSKSIVDEFLYQSNNDTFDRSRPIILSAHDPLRYIGDILAFVHSTIVNEVELITNLFEIGESSDPEYERSVFEKELIKLENLEDVNRSVKTTIERVVGSLSRPLKVRVEQIVRSEKRLDVLQKVFGLLDLYKVMFTKQLGQNSECSILETLETLKLLCVERVFSVLRERQAVMEKEFESSGWAMDDDSLMSPDWLRDFLADVLSIFDDSAMDHDTKIMGLDDETFKSLCTLVIDKPMELVITQAKKHFKGDKVSSLIYRLNCLDVVSSKMVVISQLSKSHVSIMKMISLLEHDLIEEQYTLLLRDAGLEIHQRLIQLVYPIEQIESEDDYFMYTSLIENKLFGKAKLKEIEAQLHEFLPTAVVDIQQAVFKISSPSIANKVVTGSSLKFINLYEIFLKIVRMLYEDDDEPPAYEFSSFDVATLLGVGDLYRASS